MHLTHAIREDRVLLSGNHHDFEALHDLLMRAGGRHPGILIIRRDNDAACQTRIAVWQVRCVPSARSAS